MPNFGVTAEFAEKDVKNDVTEYYSGGKGYYAAQGVELYFKKYAFGLNYSLPIYENLNQNLVTTNHRVSAQFIYLF